MFRRDQTTQAISCSPWSTRPHPYLSLIRKMKTNLELEDELGNQLCINTFCLTKFLGKKDPSTHQG